MDSLSKQNLDNRNDELRQQYQPQQFVRDVNDITTLIEKHLLDAAAGKRPVWPATPPEKLLASWPDPETTKPQELKNLIAATLSGSTCQHHPGYIGQQLSVPPLVAGPIGMAASILNNSSAVFVGGPVAVAMEHRVISWMARKINYGLAAGGILTSGGTLGCLTALLAMRQAMMNSDVWSDGMNSSDRVAIFASDQSHYCNKRACAILGFGERAVVPVPTDENFRMDLDSLKQIYEKTQRENIRAIALIANACSTATGSHDPLKELAEFCQQRGLWFHVDAAHGGSALLSPKFARRLDGINQADSVVWDAHKMMLMPSFCTAVIFRDRKHLDAAFRQQASYLFTDTDTGWEQPGVRSFETTKPTMSFQLYLSLVTLGVDFFAKAVEYAYDLAQAFALEIERRQDFELLIPPESNIVCFRYSDGNEPLDNLQIKLREAINQAGNFFIMRTELRGKTWLRVVLMNPLTRLDHLIDLLDDVTKLAR